MQHELEQLHCPQGKNYRRGTKSLDHSHTGKMNSDNWRKFSEPVSTATKKTSILHKNILGSCSSTSCNTSSDEVKERNQRNQT